MSEVKTKEDIQKLIEKYNNQYEQIKEQFPEFECKSGFVIKNCDIEAMRELSKDDLDFWDWASIMVGRPQHSPFMIRLESPKVEVEENIVEKVAYKNV